PPPFPLVLVVTGRMVRPAVKPPMTAVRGRDATVQTAYSGEASGQAASGQAASHQAAPAQANAIRLGPRARRLIRSVARIVNPLVLGMAGRRYMPVLGIVHHTGRRTGRRYATPLGVRPAVGGGFVMPLTFGEAAGWYRNTR